MENEMKLTEKFDRAKKLAEVGNLNPGYQTKSREFELYLTKEEWQQFKDLLPFTKYEKNELEEYTSSL